MITTPEQQARDSLSPNMIRAVERIEGLVNPYAAADRRAREAA